METPKDSSPSKASAEDSLAYYKAQYEQLEAELADFQSSSKELEAELERDVEAAEKRERDLRQKVETLTYEVEELKTKYKQSKQEGNNAQNTLQKEITALRESNRSLQSRLRDIEVSNDDMERQARNTSSSLEDLESKYNHAIERGVLADEEVKAGEQEREALRIDAQRLRDELNDLKIEAELRQERLRKAEALAETHALSMAQLPAAPDLPRSQSAMSESSPTTSNSSPTLATPATKSASSTVSEVQTPPSPPISESSNPARTTNPGSSMVKPGTKTEGSLVKPKTRPSDIQSTPKPCQPSSRLQRYSRGPSAASATDRLTSLSTPKPSAMSQRPSGMVKSGSLYHLKGLMNKTQTLTQRVHTLQSRLPESKLPAPTATPPRASPRSGSALGQSSIPSNITVRSSKKRTGGSNIPASQVPGERPASRLSSTFSHGGDRPSSRLSFGIPQPSPAREIDSTRPVSRDAHSSRPGSRAGQAHLSMSHGSSASVSSLSRPGSRQSMSGSRTPLGHYTANVQTEPRRPRSSMGRAYGNEESSHGHSSSVSRLSNYGSHLQQTHEEETDEVVTPTPSRRTTFNKESTIGIAPLTTTKSKLAQPGSARRTSGGGDMGPPERKPNRKLSEVGESY